MRGGADAGRAAVASRYRAAGRELKVSLVEIPERLRTQDQLLGYLLVHLCLLWTGRCYGSALHDVLLLCVKSRERRSGARRAVHLVEVGEPLQQRRRPEERVVLESRRGCQLSDDGEFFRSL